MTDVTVFAVDWLARDRQHPKVGDHFCVTMFGRDVDGRSVAVHVRTPVAFLVHKPSFEESDYHILIAESVARLGASSDMCTTVSRRSAWGYDGGVAKTFAQLAFRTRKRAQIARGTIAKRDGFDTFEGTADPILRLFHARDVDPAGWIKIKGAKIVDPDHAIARYVDAEYECSFGDISRADDAPTTPPKLVIASWDLECYSSTGGFPSGGIVEDKIIQAAVTFRRYDEPAPYRSIVFCLGDTVLPPHDSDDPTAPPPEAICFEEEADMIHGFFDSIAEERADVMIGYNTDQFDWKYIVDRSKVLRDDATFQLELDLSRLGKIDPELDPSSCSGEPDEFELTSGAFGENKYTSVRIPGILSIDLLTWFRRETKNQSYSLNAMSARYLGDSKIDLPAWQIFKKWASGVPEERGLIAAYAAKDTLLPVKLLERMCIFENTQEMANATSCPMSYIFRRGQQIKVFSQLLRTGRSMGVVFPDNKGIGLAPGTKFAGAVVLEAKKGAYYDIVSGLDFASLYPSIIRAHNMSPDTLVMNGKNGNVEGIEYYEIETDQGTFRFAQKPLGVLPKLLEDLAAFRKKAKKDMADAKKRGDTFAYNLFNAKQLAFKISMNSAYGFFGASKGFLPCVPISASVTATGRKMIEKTKFLAETLVPGSNVVYGDTDSVMVNLNLGPEKRHDMKAHFEAAAKLADEISKTFKYPIELEFEKTYYPYLLYSKKRYAGRMFSSSPDKPDYNDVKGLALVRRDFAPIVKTASEAVLEKLLDEQDPEGAIATARDAVISVLDAPPGCDMTPYIMSKTLRGSYKNTAQPHLFVSKKILERTGEPVPSGARVPYVFTRRADETLLGTKSGQAEDPTYAKDHEMELDKLYYVNNQLRTPLVSMLEVVDDNVEKRIFTPDIEERLNALALGEKEEIREQKRLKFVKDNKLRPITDFFKKKVN